MRGAKIFNITCFIIISLLNTDYGDFFVICYFNEYMRLISLLSLNHTFKIIVGLYAFLLVPTNYWCSTSLFFFLYWFILLCSLGWLWTSDLHLLPEYQDYRHTPPSLACNISWQSLEDYIRCMWIFMYVCYHVLFVYVYFYAKFLHSLTNENVFIHSSCYC
jgi:hypothetical protein